MFGFGRIKKIEDWVHETILDFHGDIIDLETRIKALEAKIPTVASVKAEVETAVGVAPMPRLEVPPSA